MPELPDVEVIRSYLARTILHQKITKVQIKEKDLLSSSKSTLYSMKDDSFEDTHRHGKYCFLFLKSGKVLVLHFGMTGDVRYYKEEGDDPEFAAVIFELSDEHKFAFINVRKLGDIHVEKSREAFIEEKEMGPDALAVSPDEFREIIRSKSGKIKSALMDQKSIAGIGNIYADEILYHAGFHPEKNVDDLKEVAIDKVYDKMLKVLKTAIENKADPEQMPDHYLIRRREEGRSCGLDKGKIKKIRVNGRSTYYCPEHQS